MIYTVTFNPSLDYVIGAEKLEPGKINRTTRENIYPGGKGNNVSVVLSNLGHKSKALGFVSGFTGEALEKMLDDFGCYTDFIQLDNGFTRINVKINAGEETEINGQGPRISEEAIGKLYEKLDALTKGDVLVLAGSIPNTLPEDIYERIMARLDGRGIRIVVDATKDLLMNVLKYHPFLIKPNLQELEELAERRLFTREEIIAQGKRLQEMGAKNVLISLAAEGAILLTAEGEILFGEAPRGKLVNAVGAGDSMVGGFVAGWVKTGNYCEALQWGVAAGSASAFCETLATGEEIRRLYDETINIIREEC